MNLNKKYKLIIMGAGPGGYTAAFRAADLGIEVLLIDKDSALGGVCLNRGCIPSKTLLHISKVITESHELKKMGIIYPKPKIELNTISNWKNNVINKLENGIVKMAKARGVTIATGIATIVSDNKIRLNDKEILFENLVIATGSSAISLPIIKSNDKRILNSKSALELKEIPKNLLVIGGGYIGLELGSVFNALGSQVSIVEYMNQILPGTDAEIVTPLFRSLSKNFEKIFLNTKVVSIDENNKELNIQFENETDTFKESYSHILVSVGRKPNTQNIGLENVNIKTDNDFIIVDEFQKTSIPTIYAIGDVTGNPMLAHKATAQGKIAAEVIAGESSAFDAKVIPCVIFTDPEIAWAGITEEDAKKRNLDFSKSVFPWAANGKSLSMGRIEGKTKLIFDNKTKKIIGGAIVGPNAGNLISEICLAIEMGADSEDLSLTIHPHPTTSESIFNAAEMFEGTITDLYIPKK